MPELPRSIFDQTMALPYHLYVISTQVPGMPLQIQYGAALVLLLMAAAYRSLRGRVNGRVLSSLLVVGAATVLGLTGGQMMQRAQAVAFSAQLSQAGGGSVSVEEGETEVVNTSGVPQQIRALRVVDPQNPLLWHWLEPLSGTPQCVVGQVLAPAGKCYVSLAQNPG